MFRILNGKSPTYLQEGITKTLFKLRMDTHGQKTFLFKGISLWNSLPTSVQSQQCKDIFKLEVKKHLFSELSKTENAMYILINQAGPDSFVYVVFRIC